MIKDAHCFQVIYHECAKAIRSQAHLQRLQASAADEVSFYQLDTWRLAVSRFIPGALLLDKSSNALCINVFHV